ncbi:hypothetical protein SISSUDRAFT_968675, partial [Sistotremastrum suecicum HHB10207 ss-3]
PGIRRFIWEHLVDVDRILHRLKHAGITVAVKKLIIATPEISSLGHTCNFYGRRPDDSHVKKILSWP